MDMTITIMYKDIHLQSHMTFAKWVCSVYYCITLYYYVLYDTCTVGKLWKHGKLISIIIYSSTNGSTCQPFFLEIGN